MIFLLAWKNIWRNKRRSLITMASIFCAVFFALIMRSFQIGTFGHIIDNVVSSYTGYIQIHKKGYSDEKIINNCFDNNLQLTDSLKTIKNISLIVPRLESFALASIGTKTKGVMVIGINPKEENKLTKLKNKLTKGSYLSQNDRSVLVAKNLAHYLHIDVGDTIILLGQGYHGISAADKYPVKGILRFPSPDLNNKLVYMPLKTCQEFYSIGNKLTTLAINIKDKRHINKTVEQIKSKTNNNLYEVLSWKKILPNLVQLIDSKTYGSYIVIGILYLIIAFGVFGTILMMIMERKREIGLLIAIGMQKTKLVLIICIETIYIGLVGLLSGIAASIPIIFYGYYHPIKVAGDVGDMWQTYGFEPILVFSNQFYYFFNQCKVVSVIILLSILYPIYFISKVKVANTIKNN